MQAGLKQVFNCEKAQAGLQLEIPTECRLPCALRWYFRCVTSKARGLGQESKLATPHKAKAGHGRSRDSNNEVKRSQELNGRTERKGKQQKTGQDNTKVD
eukprot:6183488-Pleurochrysis_carterae.AAC.2